MKLTDLQYAGVAFAVFCIAVLGATFFILVYIVNLWQIMLHTPETVWEWEAALEGTKDTFGEYWRWFNGDQSG